MTTKVKYEVYVPQDGRLGNNLLRGLGGIAAAAARAATEAAISTHHTPRAAQRAIDRLNARPCRAGLWIDYRIRAVDAGGRRRLTAVEERAAEGPPVRGYWLDYLDYRAQRGGEP